MGMTSRNQSASDAAPVGETSGTKESSSGAPVPNHAVIWDLREERKEKGRAVYWYSMGNTEKRRLMVEGLSFICSSAFLLQAFWGKGTEGFYCEFLQLVIVLC